MKAIILLAAVLCLSVFVDARQRHRGWDVNQNDLRVNGREQRQNLRAYYTILDAFEDQDYEEIVPVYNPITLRWQNDDPVQVIHLQNKADWLSQYEYYARSVETLNVTAVNDRVDYCFHNILTPYATCGTPQITTFCGIAYYNHGHFTGERFTGDLAPMYAWFANNFGCGTAKREYNPNSLQPVLGISYGL